MSGTSRRNTMASKINSSDISENGKKILDAAYKGQLKKIKTLSTKCRHDVKLLSETLIQSCRRGHLHVVKWIVLHTAADVNFSGVIRGNMTWREEIHGYYTSLTAACNYKRLDIVKYLVETCHANVHLPDNQLGYTPLIAACVTGGVSEAMYLLNGISDLDVNIADKHGYTALHFAVSSKRNSRTQLHLACIKGDTIEVKKLVSVDDQMINMQDNGGYTPLHYACRLGYSEIVKTLMFAGADETITDIDWQTPAQLAEEKGYNELLKFLDKVTLWEEIQTSNVKKLSVYFLVILALKIMEFPLSNSRYCYLRHNHHKVRKTIKKCIIS